MTESVLAIVSCVIGVIVLCFASIVLALKVKGDKIITWRGFGVAFMISPCHDCHFAQRRDGTFLGDN